MMCHVMYRVIRFASVGKLAIWIPKSGKKISQIPVSVLSGFYPDFITATCNDAYHVRSSCSQIFNVWHINWYNLYQSLYMPYVKNIILKACTTDEHKYEFISIIEARERIESGYNKINSPALCGMGMTLHVL